MCEYIDKQSVTSMNNKHLSWYKEINNNFIIASRAYFLQKCRGTPCMYMCPCRETNMFENPF